MKHKYSVGELVTWTSSHSFNPTIIVHEIIRLLPEDDGEFGYRLKSTLNGYERSVRESEIRALETKPNLSKTAGSTIRKKLLGWWALTIVLGALGGMFLVGAFRDPGRDAYGMAFPGLLFGLTALALYVHKLRPKLVEFSNRARAEALAEAGFTE
jgi:hypothetical protein